MTIVRLFRLEALYRFIDAEIHSVQHNEQTEY